MSDSTQTTTATHTPRATHTYSHTQSPTNTLTTRERQTHIHSLTFIHIPTHTYCQIFRLLYFAGIHGVSFRVRVNLCVCFSADSCGCVATSVQCPSRPARQCPSRSWRRGHWTEFGCVGRCVCLILCVFECGSVGLVHRAIALIVRGPTIIIIMIIIRGIRKTEWREHDIMYTRKYVVVPLIHLSFHKKPTSVENLAPSSPFYSRLTHHHSSLGNEVG